MKGHAPTASEAWHWLRFLASEHDAGRGYFAHLDEELSLIIARVERPRLVFRPAGERTKAKRDAGAVRRKRWWPRRSDLRSPLCRRRFPQRAAKSPWTRLQGVDRVAGCPALATALRERVSVSRAGVVSWTAPDLVEIVT